MKTPRFGGSTSWLLHAATARGHRGCVGHSGATRVSVACSRTGLEIFGPDQVERRVGPVAFTAPAVLESVDPADMRRRQRAVIAAALGVLRRGDNVDGVPSSEWKPAMDSDQSFESGVRDRRSAYMLSAAGMYSARIITPNNKHRACSVV